MNSEFKSSFEFLGYSLSVCLKDPFSEQVESVDWYKYENLLGLVNFSQTDFFQIKGKELQACSFCLISKEHLTYYSHDNAVAEKHGAVSSSY